MSNNCPCCEGNKEIPADEKVQFQMLSLDNATGLLSIIPGGNDVDLCPAVKFCETKTTVDDLRLVGNQFLELLYRNETGVASSHIVDLSTLAVEVVPFTIADSNTVDLQLNGIELTAHVKIDPASTAAVSASIDGLRIDTSAGTLLNVASSDAIELLATGVDNHDLTANLIVDDTDTVDLSIGGTGLTATVIVSNDPDNLLTVTDGLFVDKAAIEALIDDDEPVDVEPPLEYDSVDNIISIPAADDLTDGYLAATDWIDFDQKVDPTRLINTTAPLAGGGDLSNDLTLSIIQANSSTDGYLSFADWNIFNDKLDTSRLINTTAPLTGGGDLTADLTLAIAQATTLVPGYLSAADWTTFNGKANTATNIGTGGAIFKQKTVGNNLELRTITGTAGQIVITQSADTVNIAIDPDFDSGGGGGTDLIVEDDGVNLTSAAVSLDFVGAGVTATQSGGDVTVTIPGFSTAMSSVSYVDGTYTANIADVDKVIFLKATTANVTYNVSPSTFSGRKIIVYSMNTSPFTVTLVATSGTIVGLLAYGPADNECVTLYSDGTDIFAIAKN